MKSPLNALVTLVLLAVTLTAIASAGQPARTEKKNMTKTAKASPATEAAPQCVVKPEAEWKQLLTPEQYRVLRQKGTERAFTGAYWDHHAKGGYLCAACGYELFDSRQKFDSGTGWPSFWQTGVGGHVSRTSDRSVDLFGVEVTCARCGGHLGHVFNDGPAPTGLRYCINSAALKFLPAK